MASSAAEKAKLREQMERRRLKKEEQLARVSADTTRHTLQTCTAAPCCLSVRVVTQGMGHSTATAEVTRNSRLCYCIRLALGWPSKCIAFGIASKFGATASSERVVPGPTPVLVPVPGTVAFLSQSTVAKHWAVNQPLSGTRCWTAAHHR